jgi:ketosteroid isomerase-like protein
MPIIRTCRSLVTAFLFLSVPLGAQATHRAQAPQAPRTSDDGEAKQVAATLLAVFAAAERNDMKALDSLYAGDSLTVFEGAGVNRGWTDYRDHHLAPELLEMKNFQYRPADLEVHVDGRTAWVLFRYTLKAEVNGRMSDAVGRGTAILERRGPRWVVRHTQTSSRARRPTDPA